MDPDKKLKQMSERSRSAKGKVKRRDFMLHEDEEEDGEEEEEEEEENVARAWQQSSRIFRVSGSGGKDRHSKVYTTKGLRDRRVRLSVSTAIQFYDLQDRLGYDRPSKAVEWLIKAAADAIAELPPLNGTFSNGIVPRHQQELQNSSPHNDSFCESGKEEESGREEWVMVDRGGCEADPELDLTTHRHFSANLTKSACSSTSETSKGSVLSLSRCESRVKARERARERAKEREKVDISTATTVSTGQHALNSHGAGSFTDLLMDVNVSQHNPGFSQKVRKQVVSGDGPKRAATAGEIVPFASPAMDYLNAGVFSSDFLQASKNHNHNHPSSGQSQFGGPLPLMSIVPFNNPSGFMGSVDHHPELQQFSFFQDRVIPVASSNDNNLNFSMSSLTAAHNRGTLQSNSSLLPHIQKVSSPISVDGGPSMPFFIPTAHAAAAVAAANQFPGVFDGRRQLYHGDGCRHLDPKGKGKG